MALRDQPYLPLYVQDILTDEKLIECSAESHGVYLRLLCIFHKQEDYGSIKLKAKYKHIPSKVEAFAEMLSRQMPFIEEEIEVSLKELIEADVIQLNSEVLSQKRMVKDGDLSLKRASAGSLGGKSQRAKPKQSASKATSKSEAAPENESTNENETKDESTNAFDIDKDNILDLFRELNVVLHPTRPCVRSKQYMTKIKARLQTYSAQEILEAANNLIKDPFMNGDNNGQHKYATMEYLTRNDEHVHKWLESGQGKMSRLKENLDVTT